MPITEGEWQSISNLVRKEIRRAQAGGVFGIVRVQRTNDNLKVFWTDDYSDPIPIFAHDYKVVTYDRTPEGSAGYAISVPPGNPSKLKKVTAKVELEMPEKGDYAIVFYSGNNRDIPRCLGFLKSKQFAISPDE